MVEFSDEAIAAIQELESDASPVCYVILGFGAEFGKTLDVKDKGPGGIAQVREKLQGYEEEVLFGAFKVTAVDDRSNTVSVRRKYIQFSWVGPKVKVMKKAKVGTMSGAIKAKFEGMSLYLQAFDLDVFKEDTLEKQLRAVGGAHQPTSYDFTNEFKHDSKSLAEATAN